MAKGTIVISLRSRGVASFTKGTAIDLRYQAIGIATEILDVICCIVLLFYHLTWTSWISLVTTAVITGVDVTGNDIRVVGEPEESNNIDAAMPLQFFIPFFAYVNLPLLLLNSVRFT